MEESPDNLDAQDSYGNTVLLMAVDQSQVRISPTTHLLTKQILLSRKLLDAGASPYIPNRKGNSIFHIGRPIVRLAPFLSHRSGSVFRGEFLSISFSKVPAQWLRSVSHEQI